MGDKARYLDTEMGRFISQDPKSISNPEAFLDDPQQQNSYAYARNNPIVYIDPTGEAAYAIAKGIEANPIGAHVAIVLKPDNLADFTNQNIPIQEGGYWVIGGYADDSGSTLIKAINAPSDLNAYEHGIFKAIEEIQRPAEISDTEFISRLQTAYNAYAEDAQYDPFARNGYSSNNLATSWILEAGGKLPFGGNAPGIDPGYGSPLSSNYIKSSGISYVPTTIPQAVSGLAGYGTNLALQGIANELQRISNRIQDISLSVLRRLSSR